MKACEGRIGRVFVIRLEDGDVVPECIERFAEEKGVSMVGLFWWVELGVGVLAPSEDAKPVLHIHAALGRAGQTMIGCLWHGVTTWLVGEGILHEILGADIARIQDEQSGFELLEPRSN